MLEYKNISQQERKNTKEGKYTNISFAPKYGYYIHIMGLHKPQT